MIHSSSTVLPPSHSYIVVQSLIIVSVDSGHGGQVPDETGTESDGMDEGMYELCIALNFPANDIRRALPSVIFPADFKSTSHIVDNVRFNL